MNMTTTQLTKPLKIAKGNKMKNFTITISQDGKYPGEIFYQSYKSKTYGIQASGFGTAINRAIKKYRQEFKENHLKELKILAKKI